MLAVMRAEIGYGNDKEHDHASYSDLVAPQIALATGTPSSLCRSSGLTWRRLPHEPLRVE